MGSGPMEGESIAVVVPAFDREAVIGRALASVRCQTFVPSELVVVDDGSTDATAAVAKSMGARVVHQSNAGAGAARNAGVAATTAPWVAFLDSDDEWDPRHLERMVNALRVTGERASLYFSDTWRSTSTGVWGSHWDRAGFHIDGAVVLRDRPSSWATSPVHPMMIQSSVLRREAFDRAGGFRPELRTREDTHLLLAMTLSEPVCAVAGVGAVMHDDAGVRIGERDGVRSLEYWRCTELLYSDLVGRSAQRPTARRTYSRRLADAHVHLALAACRDRRPGSAAAWLARSLEADPFMLPGRALARAAGYVGARSSP